MKINRSEFLQSLKSIKPAIDEKDNLEQANSFIFNNGNIHTYNDEIGMQIESPVNIDAVVKAKELYSLLGKIKDDEISISMKDNEFIIKGKRIKAGIKKQEETLINLDEIFPKIDKWSKVPDDFKKALSICLLSASKDNTRPILTCLHIKDDIIESSDNEQLTIYTMSKKCKVFKKGILIPENIVKDLIKYNITHVSYNRDNWIDFKSEENVIISCRMYKGEYADLSQFILNKGTKITFPNNINDILNKMEVFQKEEQDALQTVNIKINKGIFSVRSENQYGWVEESVKTKNKKNVIFNVGPKILLNILNTTKKAMIGDNVIQFNTDNYVHIIAKENNND